MKLFPPAVGFICDPRDFIFIKLESPFSMENINVFRQFSHEKKILYKLLMYISNIKKYIFLHQGIF